MVTALVECQSEGVVRSGDEEQPVSKKGYHGDIDSIVPASCSDRETMASAGLALVPGRRAFSSLHGASLG